MQITNALKAHIERKSNIVRTGRVLQLEGMFDVPPSENNKLEWNVNLPLHEKEWSIGLIVGPSGCGKSTIAKELFGNAYIQGYEWDEHKALIDCFPLEMSVKEITLLLSSVGFSSPPSWLRPFGVLSNGEQFRANIARTLAENPKLSVIDEFTSVVDRTVAKIGSTAIQKTVRNRKGKLIAVSCHYDIEDWLDPDWVYEPAINNFKWRLLRGRPQINLEIKRINHENWKIFSKHHYLDTTLNKSAVCFGGYIDGQLVAFDSWLPFFGKLSYGKARRVHRAVCLPDFQGAGIANAMLNATSSMWKALGFRVFLGTGHPAMVQSKIRSKEWKMTRPPARTAKGNHAIDKTRSSNRYMASFEYMGQSLNKQIAQNLYNG